MTSVENNLGKLTKNILLALWSPPLTVLKVSNLSTIFLSTSVLKTKVQYSSSPIQRL